MGKISDSNEFQLKKTFLNNWNKCPNFIRFKIRRNYLKRFPDRIEVISQSMISFHIKIAMIYRLSNRL